VTSAGRYVIQSLHQTLSGRRQLTVCDYFSVMLQQRLCVDPDDHCDLR
jgi:hypothetical protein